jgi:hypothetical protein
VIGNVLVLRADGPPPGAPPEWDRMPWAAQERWIRRHGVALRAQAGPDPVDLPVELEPDGDHQVDAKGRRIWTDEQMRAACAAHKRAQRNPSIALSDDVIDAWRAYRRTKNGRPDRPKRPHPTPRPASETAAIVLGLTTRGATPTQICAELDRDPRAIGRALERAGHPGLGRLYSDLHNTQQRAQRAAARDRVRAALEPP